MVRHTILENGAKVLDQAQPKGHPNPDHSVVLAYWNPSVQPYVTWCVDSNGEAYWGHYFTDRESAQQDFEKRCK